MTYMENQMTKKKEETGAKPPKEKPEPPRKRFIENSFKTSKK